MIIAKRSGPDQNRLVGERVAVDEQNVGQRARLDDAKLAFMAHQVAADRGRAAQAPRPAISRRT